VNTAVTRSRSQIAIHQTGAVILAWAFLLSRMVGLGVMVPTKHRPRRSAKPCERPSSSSWTKACTSRSARTPTGSTSAYQSTGPQGELLEQRTEWEAVI